LHGGLKGFDKVYWDATLLQEGDGVRFTYTSKDDEEGFPGNLKVSVIYRVLGNALHIEYNAVTDKKTPVNLTSHCYFNLSGGKETNILNHELQLNADSFVEVDDESIPTGKLISVKNTAMDFKALKKIGPAISEVNGYDHSWVLNKTDGELINAALLVHKESGVKMTVYTTEPAIHFYSGNFLDETLMNNKNGQFIKKYAGLCLETQHFPDSPNNNNFPNTLLYPGEEYRQKTIYKFENEINN
jgi:aldose 1-epimerase